MSDKESDSDQQCYTKKRKLENQNPNQNELAVAGPSNVEPLSDIFKMNIDCFEEVFEYLLVTDLRTLRRICKRFKKIVDHYISIYYPSIGKFKLNDKNFDMFRQMDASTIGWIREIDVSIGSDFDSKKFSSIKTILNNVKEIFISKWKTNPDFYNCFLKYCKNVKFVSLEKKHLPYIDISNEWLNYQYPSIEHIRLDILNKNKIDIFVNFFHLNPNIHALSVQVKSYIEIATHLVEAGIKFDRFYIGYVFIDEDVIDSLKKLYDAGFYKRISLTFNGMILENNETYSKFSSIGTEVLNSDFFNIPIPPLPNLEELNVYTICNLKIYENARNFVERLHCNLLNSKYILEIIGNFPKLKLFKIDRIYGADVLNLIEMNKEREKLSGAGKTIIYVQEDIFLATKWATTKMNFNFIELKRSEAFDWDQLFESNCGKCAH